MIDPRNITPLLSNMTVDRMIANGKNATIYLVSRRMDGKKLALKHISIPVSDNQTNALIYSGAVKNESQAHRYYGSLVKDIKNELLSLNGIKNAPNVLKFRGYQVDEKYVGAGYDVYLLSDYLPNLTEYLSAHTITKLQALNLAIDLCSALEQLRSAGLIHRNVHPRNVFHSSVSHFLLGDLGVSPISDLSYTSMPDSQITEYTAPEVLADSANLSETMDIYSVGMILYELYSGSSLNEDGAFQRTAEELPAPAYADVALSEIILRACAYDPDERYQDPTEFKQALVLYLQRGDVTNAPLLPQPETPEDQEDSVDDSASAETAEDDSSDTQDAVQETPDSETAEMIEAPEEPEAPPVISAFDQVVDDSTPEQSLNNLGADELLLPTSGDISIEEFIASLQKGSSLEVLSMDEEGNMSTVPGYETEETLPEDTQYVDSADTPFPTPTEFLDQPMADYCDDSEALPEPVDADSDIDLPLDASEPSETSADAEPALEESQKDSEFEAPQRPSRPIRRHIPQPEYDDTYDEEEYEESGASTWKKVLISIIVLLVLAGGSFALYTFKTDTIHTVSSQVLSATSIQVLADTKNHSAMEVVCSTASGEVVATVPYTDGGAIFTDLSPDTTYSFTMASKESKLILGTKTVTAKTNEMTNLTGFAASSVSAVSATLALRGTGNQPDTWVVTLTSDAGETVTASSETIPIMVEGLTPNTKYTAVISRGDGDILGGTTSCEFTTQDYTRLASFETTQISTDSITVGWNYSGTVPTSWTVTCTGTDGSQNALEIDGTECTINGLVSGETYTISLSCPSLEATELSTISVSVPSVTITSIVSTVNEDGTVSLSWEYTADNAPAEWSITYAYIGADGNATDPTLITSDSNSAILSDLVPNTNYDIEITSADSIRVGGDATTSCRTGEAEPFTEYGCENAELTLYALEDNPDALETSTTYFSTSNHIAFAIEVNYEATEADKTATTAYVIRNADGNPLYIYNSSRSWPGTWTTARHTGDLPDTIPQAGSYTFEAYFNGRLMASAEFTVE